MPSKDIHKLAEQIKAPRTKVIFMVGAGISTSAGIPDFRSPKTGLYHNLQKLNLPYAEAVFDIQFFKQNPKPFYMLAQELYPGQFVPTRFHFLMALLQKKGLLKRTYTQNIDTLERVAGLKEGVVIEAHGSFAKNHCTKCKAEYPNDLFKEKVFQREQPKCLKCKGLVKPDIVFFGEGLPEEFFQKWEDDIEDLDDAEPGEYVTITAGTSLTVYPFASLPSEVSKKHLRVLVNKEKVGDFVQSPRESDMIFLEESDVFADELVKALGWTDEFEELITETEQKIKGTSPKETKEEKLEDIKHDIETLEKEEESKDEEDVDEVTKKLERLDVDANEKKEQDENVTKQDAVDNDKVNE